MKINSLKNTIKLMISDDYKERFKAEYYQLEIRRNKLILMLDAWDDGKLPFTPTCSRELYDEQLHYMNGYLRILKRRAHDEGVIL